MSALLPSDDGTGQATRRHDRVADALISSYLMELADDGEPTPDGSIPPEAGTTAQPVVARGRSAAS